MAKEVIYDRGTILLTKDGRKVGNAIILGAVEPENPINYKIKNVQYLIKTDFGNVFRLTHKDIKEFFHKPYREELVEDWLYAKTKLVEKGLK